MRLQLSQLVITPENESTAKRLIEVTQTHDQPEQLYLTGPANSGKSTFMEARGAEKDLLSIKHALYCHASEILAMLSIDNENADNFLNRIGEVEVLLIDDVEDFLTNEKIGVKACQLLIESRAKQGLDTIVAAQTPLLQLDGNLQDVFSGFEEICLPALSEQGLIDLARMFEAHFVHAKGEEKAHSLSDEAIAYLGKKFQDSPKDMAPAVQFLVTVADFPEGHIITAEEAEASLQL